MPDSELLKAADQFRRAILKRERRAAVRLITAYGIIWNRLLKNISSLGEEITAARERGEVVNQFWLIRQERYFQLLAQVNVEMRKFGEFAETTISKQQELAAKAGLSNSIALMETAAEGAGIATAFNKLPVSAVENLVGTLGNGSPLRTLLDRLPAAGRQIVEQGLIEGVALGRNPRAIASEIRKGLGGNLNRALTISRTETLRAYRTATIQAYQANSDVVTGWYWRSGRSRRCCAACVALDGTFWTVRDPMRPHPRCRCTMIPGVKGVTVDKGSTWFNKQDAETQKAIIGTKSGYAALKAGELKLQDFVGLERNPVWGDSYHQLSVKRAFAGEGQFPK